MYPKSTLDFYFVEALRSRQESKWNGLANMLQLGLVTLHQTPDDFMDISNDISLFGVLTLLSIMVRWMMTIETCLLCKTYH